MWLVARVKQIAKQHEQFTAYWRQNEWPLLERTSIGVPNQYLLKGVPKLEMFCSKFAPFIALKMARVDAPFVSPCVWENQCQEIQFINFGAVGNCYKYVDIFPSQQLIIIE